MEQVSGKVIYLPGGLGRKIVEEVRHACKISKSECGEEAKAEAEDKARPSKNRGLPIDGHLLTWVMDQLTSMVSLFSTSTVRKACLK